MKQYYNISHGGSFCSWPENHVAPDLRNTFEKSTLSYVGLAGPWSSEKYSYIIAYKHVHVK